MSFINGLKIFFKRPLYVLIISLFILSWFLILLTLILRPLIGFATFLSYFVTFLSGFVAILVGFNLLLFVISIFKPIIKLKYYVIFGIFLISIPLVFIFDDFLSVIYIFCIIANQLFLAFFAFKLCMDTSTKVDDFLYKNEKNRIFKRIFEFILFGIIAMPIFLISWNILIRIVPFIALVSVNTFRLMFWVDIILIVIVILRVLITKKFAAYITLFFLLTFFYVLYIVIDTIIELLSIDASSWSITSFIIDLCLFLYLIGSIFDKVEYLEQKLKIIKVETISLFVILMKIVAQITEVTIDVPPLVILRQQYYYLFIFLIFTFVFGLYSIFAHKEGKLSSKITEN